MNAMHSHTFKLLGISGSLRAGSHCTALLSALRELVESTVVLETATLHEVPMYNADLDGETPPEGVLRLKRAIAASDGLVMISPEYNYGIPGVLKNVIDWASRPGFNSPLRGKPALIITASPGMLGGARAQPQIRDALAAALARPVVRQQLAVPAIDKKLVDGRLVDQTTCELLMAGFADLLIDIQRMKASPAGN
ncbi:MAG: NAD(P)H-dependent oxidoreductase [Variovorax sp.]